MPKKPKHIGDPRSFIFDGAAWTVEEREPQKMDLPPHLSVLYFRCGRQRRWATHPRSLLRMLGPHDLVNLLQAGTPISADRLEESKP